MEEQNRRLTCMDVHPGDFVLIKSFGYPQQFITKIKNVGKYSIEDTKGNSISFYAVYGIPLVNEYLEQLDFLKADMSDNDDGSKIMFLKDNIAISPMDNILSSFVTFQWCKNGTYNGICTSDCNYVHEVQHWYYEKTKNHMELSFSK